MDINKKLGYFIPRGKKVRLFTLGCGSVVINSLMCEGASEWLYSTHILYAKEATESYCSKNDSKFVSEERLRDICETQERVEGVIDIYITATLFYKGQREDRVNQFYYLIVDGSKEFSNKIVLDNNLSRGEQESIINQSIIGEFCKQTEVIFAGSFDPMHLGHKEICKNVKNLGYERGFLQISDIHPTKGKLSREDVDDRIERLCNNASYLLTKGCGMWVPSITSQPKYIDKYNEWDTPTKEKPYLIFVVGKDVWEKYREYFENEFKNVDNVSFLVFNRYSNELKDENVQYGSELLHKASFLIEMKNLEESSTKIRKQYENTNI